MLQKILESMIHFQDLLIEVDDNCEFFFNHSILHLHNLQDRKLYVITVSVLIDRKRLLFLAWLGTLKNKHVTEILFLLEALH